MDVVNKGSANGRNAEAEGDDGDEPSWADPFAGNVGGNLEDDVADVEDGEDGIVVVARELEVLLQAGQAGVSNVCAVDEAEQVQQGDGGDDAQVNLHPQLGLGFGVELDKRMAIARHRLAPRKQLHTC